MDTPQNSTGSTGAVIGILALACFACVVMAGIGGYVFYSLNPSASPTEDSQFVTPYVVTEETEVVRPPGEPTSSDTLMILQQTVVPISNTREQACRLKGLCDIPEVMATSTPARVAGDTEMFWVNNVDTLDYRQISATLHYVTPHAYFWVEDGVSVNDSEVRALTDAFESQMYPSNREFFGSEWTPGIDGDEHIYILYARGLGLSVAGYFSSSDSAHPLAQEYSNAHEMFFFNADNTSLSDSFTYGVLAHEFQHMIHWYNDLNETTWMNEGSSVLAAFLNGYDHGGSDISYIVNTDLQLNDWPVDSSNRGAHYGSSFLFMTYFLDRFGEDATKLLVKDPANGLESVDEVLQEIQAVDPLTGEPVTADAFFMDWAVTNYLLDGSMGDGRYVYKIYPGAQRAYATDSFSNCPQDAFTRSVSQYGVDYISIECAGDYTIEFTGSTVTDLLPIDPYSGDYAFWSNKGDESDMTLTREFDLTNVSGPVELSFQTWYDIETDWDYLYVEVSENGETWDILLTPSGTGTDPSGNSFGWGYTGSTGGWVEEKVDLSEYAGKKIWVRFEYITDAAVNGEGFMVDDVSVEAIGYRSDFEADDGGWTAEGFVRIQNVLPQTFGLALIHSGDSSVTRIELNDDQTAQIPISLDAGETVILVVSGTTRITRERASYQIVIQ